MCKDHQERDELRARFTKWMEVTIYRARLNYIKAQSRHLTTMSLEDAQKDQLYCREAETPWMQNVGAEDSFDFEEESLAAAFSRLSAVKREIITMLFLLNMTPHEIADKLGCTVQYVYKQKSLALKRLRDLMKGGDML